MLGVEETVDEVTEGLGAKRSDPLELEEEEERREDAGEDI